MSFWKARALKLLKVADIKIERASRKIRRKKMANQCHCCFGVGHVLVYCWGLDKCRNCWRCSKNGHNLGLYVIINYWQIKLFDALHPLLLWENFVSIDRVQLNRFFYTWLPPFIPYSKGDCWRQIWLYEPISLHPSLLWTKARSLKRSSIFLLENIQLLQLCPCKTQAAEVLTRCARRTSPLEGRVWNACSRQG